MTDLGKTMLIAKATGFGNRQIPYNPLEDGEDAMALLCWLLSKGMIVEISDGGIELSEPEFVFRSIDGDMTDGAVLRSALVDMAVEYIQLKGLVK